jgi:hypothetical protein
MRTLGGSLACIYVHLPDQRSSSKRRSEATRSNERRHSLRGMYEHTEAPPSKPPERVLYRDHRAHVDPITRVAVAKEPARLSEGQSKKLLIIRITTDHAIQGDDVGVRQAGCRPDIGMDELDTVGVPPAAAPQLRRLEERPPKVRPPRPALHRR